MFAHDLDVGAVHLLEIAHMKQKDVHVDYVLQHAILVARLSAPALVQSAEALLRSSDFQAYARLAGIEPVARELLLAYLFHLVHVIRPSEGLRQSELLMRSLAER